MKKIPSCYLPVVFYSCEQKQFKLSYFWGQISSYCYCSKIWLGNMEPYGQYRLIREMESLWKKFKQQANLDEIHS